MEKDILDKIHEKLNALGIDYNQDTWFLFDFDNTMYLKLNDGTIEQFIDEHVILGLLLESIEQKNQTTIKYLSDVHKIDDINIFLENIKEKDYRENFTNLLAKDFGEKAAPNHRISYLTNFGFTPEQIYSRYAELAQFAPDFYKNIKSNKFIEYLFIYSYDNLRVIIYTDNSKENVLAGFPLLGIEIDGSNLPIISMFKEDKDHNVIKISTKKQETIVSDLTTFLNENMIASTANLTNFIFFDDNRTIIENMAKNGIKSVLVSDNKLVYVKYLKDLNSFEEKFVEIKDLQDYIELKENFKNGKQAESFLDSTIEKQQGQSIIQNTDY